MGTWEVALANFHNVTIILTTIKKYKQWFIALDLEALICLNLLRFFSVCLKFNAV